MKNTPGRNLTRQEFGEIFAASWSKAATAGIGTSGLRSCEMLFNPDGMVGNVFEPSLAFGAEQECP